MKKLGKIQTFAIAGLAAIALATPLALAQSSGTAQDSKQQMSGTEGRGKHGGHRGNRRGGMMFRGLNLTEEQQARMQQIRQSFGERTKDLREQLHAKRQELRQASEGSTFNEALATQKLTESASLQAKLMGEEFKLHQEMLSVLTPEQKTQLEQKREQFKAGRGKGRGMRGDIQPQQQQ